jgi:hypothetical protein
MAKTPVPELTFEGQCPDCGNRTAALPQSEPDLGDDFEWYSRDYDSIRMGMLEELAARFPERTRWTPADQEVALIEVMAVALDQLSDMADRVTAEAYLETARRPESVRRLLSFIGYDAVTLTELQDDPHDQVNALTKEQKLEQLWMNNPTIMDQARRAGPRAVHSQRRMVTLEDYTIRLEEHPIVRRAAARSHWSGSWNTIIIAVVLAWPDTVLDKQVSYDEKTKVAITRFHKKRGLPFPSLDSSPLPTHRMVLEPYLNAYRMAGQEVILDNAIPVGIAIDLTIQVYSNYFQSEVRGAIVDTLSNRSGGLFEPGRHRFGEDVHASDLFQALMGLEGVANVCLTRFKKVGSQYPDHSVDGIIRLDDLEIAVCDNDPSHANRGFYHLTLVGGRKG